MGTSSKERKIVVFVLMIQRMLTVTATEQAPQFTTDFPKTYDFSNNTGGKLICTVNEESGANINWILSDGSPVSNIGQLRKLLPDGSLVFSPFEAEKYRQDVHAVSYRCAATNSLGTLVSNEIKVKGVVSQAYDVHVYDVYAINGNAAVMRCHIPKFLNSFVTVTAWIKDSVVSISPGNFNSDSKYLLLPTGELIVTDVGSDDDHTSYRCQVLNRLTGEIKTSVNSGRLIVTDSKGKMAPKVIYTQPQIVSMVNETMIFPCVGSGLPIPAYKWQKQTSLKYRHDVQIGGKFTMVSGSLIIKNVQNSDTGMYICHVTNEVNSDTSLTQLTVFEYLKVTVTPAEATVDVDMSLTILCRVNSSIVTNIYWTKDGGQLPSDVIHRNNKTLYISKMQPQLAGIYQCFIENDLSSSFGYTVVKLGDTLPIISKGFEEKILNPGQTIILTCIASGNPIPQVEWTLDNIDLHKNKQNNIFVRESGVNEVTSTIEIPNVKVENGGIYRCSAKTRKGQSSYARRINVIGKLGLRHNIKFLAVEEGTVQIDCPVYGYPVQSIEWKQNEQVLPINMQQAIHSNGTLTIRNIQQYDNGKYICRAKGNGNQVIQTEIELVVMVPPKITPFHFPEELIREGARARVQCVVTEGQSPLKLSWLKNGQPLFQGEGIVLHDLDEFSSILMISSISPKHNGNYTCVATNNAGTTQQSARLFVNVIPKITPFFFRNNLFEGNLARISCVIFQGDLPLNIEWFKDNTPVQNNDGILTKKIDDYSSILTIKALQTNHTGNYTCVASNSAAKAKFTAQLLVHVPPKIVPFTFHDKHLQKGMLVRVSCIVSRGDLPLTIKWLKDGESIPIKLSVSVKDFDEYSSVMSIDPVTLEHSGNYSCVAQNHAGVDIHTAELSVQVRPTWLFALRNKNIRSGDNLFIDCQAEGFPEPKIYWKKAIGTDNFLEESVPVVENEHLKPYSNGTLAFLKAQRFNEGTYICIANNGVGLPLSQIILVKVQAAPEFDQISREMLVKRGEEIKILCSANGNWPIKYQWSVNNNNKIDVSSNNLRYTIEEQQDEINQKSLSFLMINWVDKKDSTVFTCTARNEIGESQMTITLIVQEIPDVPVIELPLNVINQSIELKWTLVDDGNSKIIRYVIQYKKDVDRWTDRVNTLSVPSLKTSATISNLKPATLYTFRILAENSIGNGSFSDEITAKTEEMEPNGAPESVDVESTDANTLRVTWKPPKKNLWNGALRGYNIGYKIYETSQEYTFSKLEVPEDYTEELIYQLTNLKMYTQYNIVVQAYNSKGNGPMSEPVLAMTSEDVPTSAPENVRCSSLSSTSIYVLWDSPPSETMNGILRGYKILYKPVEEWYDAHIQTKIASATKVTLNELEVHTNYSIQVLAFTKMGDGVKSSAIFCMTHEDVPYPPQSIKVLPSSTDSVVVAWMPPKRANGALIKYNIYYKEIENGQRIDEHTQNTEELLQDAKMYQSQVNNQHVELRGLKKHQKYAFWVTASSAIGESSGSNIVAQTVADSIVAAKVASFDSIIKTPWKEDIIMPCVSVGVPTPNRKWTFGNEYLKENGHIKYGQDGSVIINKVSTEDSGNYTCAVYNEYGHDTVNYMVAVEVPPAAPILSVVSKTRTSIKLQWKTGSVITTNVRGYLLHYKNVNGIWNSTEIRADHSLHTLDKLDCGSTYQIYMEAFNNVGTGTPSDTITVTTEGSDVINPPKDAIIREGSTFITVNLDTWPSSGCPVKKFAVTYKQLSGQEWNTVDENILPTQKKLIISSLSPATWYVLRLTVDSASSPTLVEYKFATHTVTGETIPLDNLSEPIAPIYIFSLDPLIFIPAVALLIVIIIASVVVCIYMKRRNGSVGTPSDVYDECNEMNAWIRHANTLPKGHPGHAMHGTLKSRYSCDDPSPYATSHLLGNFQRMDNKMIAGQGPMLQSEMFQHAAALGFNAQVQRRPEMCPANVNDDYDPPPPSHVI